MEANSWGSHFRSYVLHPYTQVKDHKSGFATTNVAAVLDGTLLGEILETNLTSQAKKK